MQSLGHPLLALLVAVAAEGCAEPSASAPCGPQTCPAGCCDSRGDCQPAGFTSCAAAGAACLDCGATQGAAVDGCGADGRCTCLAADRPCPAGSRCTATGCTEQVPPPVCDSTTQPAPDWGERDGECLPSCLLLGGDQCDDWACPGGFRALEERSYDCVICCVEVPTELETSTTMTVVDISEFQWETWASPEEMVDYQVTHELYDVNYVPLWLTFEWGPLPGVEPWQPSPSTSATASIWTFQPVDGAVTYRALAWDYLFNSTTQMSRANDVPDFWIGAMISSLCNISDFCNAEERTNIVFWSTTTPIAQSGDLIIEPHNVGVLVQNATQQFTAHARTDEGELIDVTDEVSWLIDPDGHPHPGQDTSPGSVATIDEHGLATVQSSWGRVVVEACYPKGCVPTSR